MSYSHGDGSDQSDRIEGGPPVEHLSGARHLHSLHPQPHLVLHVDLPLQLPAARHRQINTTGHRSIGSPWAVTDSMQRYS